jgi:hypothetical protein
MQGNLGRRVLVTYDAHKVIPPMSGSSQASAHGALRCMAFIAGDAEAGRAPVELEAMSLSPLGGWGRRFRCASGVVCAASHVGRGFRLSQYHFQRVRVCFIMSVVVHKSADQM